MCVCVDTFVCMYVFVCIESTEQVADATQLHHAAKGDLHRQQAVRVPSTEIQDSPQQSPVIMRRKSSIRANPAFRKSEGSRLLMGSVEGQQRSRAESEGGPGMVVNGPTRRTTTVEDCICFQAEYYMMLCVPHIFAKLQNCLFFFVHCAGCLLLTWNITKRI